MIWKTVCKLFEKKNQSMDPWKDQILPAERQSSMKAIRQGRQKKIYIQKVIKNW